MTNMLNEEPAVAEPLTALQIRFLEIIQLDLDKLMQHSADKAYSKHNTLMLRGFVCNLALAYSDRHYPAFNVTLGNLQDTFWLLNRIDLGTSEYFDKLASMAAIVRSLLARQHYTQAQSEVAL